MMAVYLLTSIDGNYISKTIPEMGVDTNKGLFWMIVQAVTVAVIFA